eukprot:4127331-Amphidinium_carterae.2
MSRNFGALECLWALWGRFRCLGSVCPSAFGAEDWLASARFLEELRSFQFAPFLYQEPLSVPGRVSARASPTCSATPATEPDAGASGLWRCRWSFRLEPPLWVQELC